MPTPAANADQPKPARAPAAAGTLEADLRAAVKGEVRFDPGSRALYATDASNYRLPPIGVVIPRDRADVIATVRVCREHGAPLLSRGGGTSLAGQCCNTAVVMDHSKFFNRVLAVDAGRRTITVEPGIVLDELQKAAAPHGLIFGPNPATHNHCTLGGMLGNNSCGINSMLAANHGNGYRTSDNLDGLEVLTYDGEILQVGATSEADLAQAASAGGRRAEIYAGLKRLRDQHGAAIRERFPKIPRRVSGYNLDDLLAEKGTNVARALVGSEGTLVTILSATLRLVPKPAARSLLVLGYPDAFLAADDVTAILPFKPIGLEGIDRRLVENMRHHHIHTDALELLPDGHGWLLVEFGGGTKAECDDQAGRVMARLRAVGKPPSMKLYDDPEETRKVWEAREAGLGATAFVKGEKDTWPGWEDSAVAPEKVGAYLRDLRTVFAKFGYDPSLYGHFGQGCIHCRVSFDLVTAEGLKTFRAFLDEASDLVVRHGGSFSGEHGDGQSRAELLPKMYGAEVMGAFREFKALWDPAGKMNPGKVIAPNGITSGLRLGPDYNPARPKTHFSFREDEGDFSRAALRCVGVGECRRHEGGTMCPSYMVTREEKDSTRGRTHLLFEMLQGDLIRDGFRSESVKDALDLCLSCKGCKGDCPVHVDVATYKAEFLAHHYQGRLRPLHAYAFGMIGRWARVASAFPRLTNFLQTAPGLGRLMKGILGVAPQRELPQVAPRTFKAWFFGRAAPNPAGPPVILWPDTFNNHYHPEVAQAATAFLERAGWRVIVPRVALCCGRPLYDYGMLDRARDWLEKILAALRAEVRAGIPLVGLEPSCTATFRDELTNLLPHDNDAQRLSRQTLLLSEFIDQKMPGYPLPKLPRRAIVHGHCHHKAVMKMTAEEKVLKRMGLDYELLDSGCCGMAGAFGFEQAHYEVSIQCGERVLLPRVREAADDTLIIANGFSCHEQIRQTTRRAPLHLAQVLELAHRAATGGQPAPFPERDPVEHR
ncbi:MAG TPA: FAD-binding and (Fe-S)-binding domain-containing protein [Opitutaceae bacterium]|nr:FAD-binding and (Fe-S)-binding domain-containing protein [Opitutaceae bacterium]